MSSPTTAYNPSMGLYFRDPRELMALKLISLCVGTVSLCCTLVASFHFLRMRRVFRHDLILLLLAADLLRGICYVGFPLVSFAVHQNRRIQSGAPFCQFSGFSLTVGIEAADVAALLIALHTVLYIVRPRRQGGGNGLYPYRYWAYTAVTMLPVLDASLAFVGGMPGFEDTGAMCYLPLRQRWYRMYLAWVPRYVLFCLIVALYVGLFLYVRFAQWRYAKAHDWSRRSSETAASATLVSSSTTSAGGPQKQMIQMNDLLPDGSTAATRKNSAVSSTPGKMPSSPMGSRKASQDGGGQGRDLLAAADYTPSRTTVDWQEADQRRKSVKFSPMVWNPETAAGLNQASELSEAPEMVRPADNSSRNTPVDGLSNRRMTWNWTEQLQFPTNTTPPLRARLSMSAAPAGEASKPATSRTRTRQPPPFSPLIDISLEQLPEEIPKQRQRRSTTASMSLYVPSGPLGSTLELGRMGQAVTPSTSALALISPPSQETDDTQRNQNLPTTPLPPPLAATFTRSKMATTDDAPARRGSAASDIGGSTLAYESGTQVTKTRSRVRKQLIMLFIYPLLYIVMWIVPFLSHVLYFDNYFNTTQSQLPVQPLWLLCLSMASLSIQGTVNSTLFMWRERPWRFRDERGFWGPLRERVRDGLGRAGGGGGGVRGCWSACLGTRGGEKDRRRGDGGAASGKSRQEMVNDGALARIRRRQEMANEATIAASSPRKSTAPRNWWDAEDQD
ncbi:hypothetical protein MGG_08803 [Pyricularia oryzae 70-15]|uniref:G protein-coupled receptor GPR1 n=3 Tax=Pyricularia oryzae TaxID=318829 RepID=G4NFJ4_PYRO7|nr:uncharacterized protein MGG_08803 [Pyricularia oryzae 70-15]EHA46801.1 hypothetical protein MGG_08803 [Pyricularia oryzae 70-15]ELQ32690.1 hypothetical protein OOU_Y34scaffold01073g8 [Pyricularia oryzae Y34]KAI7914593.1 hypothetical protein M9X92_008904 [Pyricularia oryzae]KAI7914919.1 hypothetical protein M0657_009271 [Pyricularia oryzae]